MSKMRNVKRRVEVIGLALAVLVASLVVMPTRVEAASVSVSYEDKAVTKVAIPKNEEFGLCLRKGNKEISFDGTEDTIMEVEFSKKGIVEEIEGSEGMGWFVAKKKGTTKVTLTCKKGSATCTVKVTDPFRMKLVSTKKSGKNLEIKIKNNMSKSVTVSTKDAYACYDGWTSSSEGGFNMADVKLKKSVTIKPGKTGTIVLMNANEYMDTVYLVCLNAKLGKRKFGLNVNLESKKIEYGGSCWRKGDV